MIGLTYEDVARLLEAGVPQLPSSERGFLLTNLVEFSEKSHDADVLTCDGSSRDRFRSYAPRSYRATLELEHGGTVTYVTEYGVKRWLLAAYEFAEARPTYPRGRAEDLGKKEAIEFLQSLLRRKWRDGAAQRHWIDERDVERVMMALDKDPEAYRRRLEEAGVEFPFPR